MEERYFEDFEIGDILQSSTVTVSAEGIVDFGRLFDPQIFHLDPKAAEQTIVQGLIASGWHTAAITMRLLVKGGAPIAGGIIGAGGEISWVNPTRPGDTLKVRSEIVDIAPSRSRPERGIVTIRSETRNQHGTVLQIFVGKIVVPRRAPGPPAL
jgi:acyl dehydratase